MNNIEGFLEEEKAGILEELEELSEALQPIDSSLSSRILEIMDVVKYDNIHNYSYLSLSLLLNPQTFEDISFRYYSKWPNYLKFAEWIRNVLVLAPITLTWIGLSMASRNYKAAVQLDKNLLYQPFLYLWEIGFSEQIKGGLSFSTIAWVDFILLFIVLAITFVVHYWIDVKESVAAKRAAEIRKRVENIIWSLEKVFSIIRFHATGVSNDTLQFQDRFDNILDLLAAEVKILSEASNKRAKEAFLLAQAGEKILEGTDELKNNTSEMQIVNKKLSLGIEKLVSHFEHQWEVQQPTIDSLNLNSKALQDLVLMMNSEYEINRNLMKTIYARNDGDKAKFMIAIEEFGSYVNSITDYEEGIRSAILDIKNNNKIISTELQNTSEKIRKNFEIISSQTKNYSALINQNSQVVTSIKNLVEELSESTKTSIRVSNQLVGLESAPNSNISKIMRSSERGNRIMGYGILGALFINTITIIFILVKLFLIQ